MHLPQRKLQRLKNYDYSQNGAYFITLCTQDRLCLFATIKNGKLILNNAGKMVYDKFIEIPNIYPGIEIDNFIVMPNHLHAIMTIEKHGGTTRGSFPTMPLSGYVQRFKTLTTKLYIDGVKNGKFPRFNNKLWQKSFHDHIIRNEQEYLKISEYIQTNPLSWEKDKYFV